MVHLGRLRLQSLAKDWALGYVNSLPAARGSQEAVFTKQRAHSLAEPCNCILLLHRKINTISSGRPINDWQATRCILRAELQMVHSLVLLSRSSCPLCCNYILHLCCNTDMFLSLCASATEVTLSIDKDWD